MPLSQSSAESDIPLAEAVGGKHAHLEGAQPCGLFGGAHGVFIVGEDEHAVGIGGLYGLGEQLHRGRAVFIAVDYYIRTQLAEGGAHTFAGGSRHYAIGLVRGALFVFCLRGARIFKLHFAVLDIHILYLYGEKLAVALRELKHLPGLHHMDVHLYYAALPERHHGVAERGYLLAEVIYRKLVQIGLFAHEAK